MCSGIVRLVDWATHSGRVSESCVSIPVIMLAMPAPIAATPNHGLRPPSDVMMANTPPTIEIGMIIFVGNGRGLKNQSFRLPVIPSIKSRFVSHCDLRNVRLPAKCSVAQITECASTCRMNVSVTVSGEAKGFGLA